jgi:SAM-dependent methyltransferase
LTGSQLPGERPLALTALGKEMNRRNLLKVLAASFALLLFGIALAGEKRNEKTKPMRNPDVVYVGTAYDLVSKMLQMANVQKGDLVYDLGCGDGRMLILAAQKYGCRGIGYDIDPERVLAARENVEKNHVEKLVQIVQADIFTLDLSKATVFPLYLLPDMNRKLLPQFEKVKPGSRIVCHNYDLDGIIAEQTFTVISNEDNASHTLSLYITPLRKR